MVVNELFVDLFFPLEREAFHLVFDVTFIFHLTTQTPTAFFSIPFSVFFHRKRTTGTTTARGKLVSRTRKQIERER